MAIAYLVTEYPARSHTFIRREVAALRAQGVTIDLYAIRRPDPADVLDEREQAAYDETTPILPAGPGAVLAAHGWAFVRSPRRWLRTLALAWRHRHAGARPALWALFHFTEAILLSRRLAGTDARHIHAHFATSAAQIALLAHTYLDLPWSLTLHGTCDFEYPAGPLLGGKLETVEFAACASHFGRAQALRTIPPALWDRCVVVRCGIEPDALPVPGGERRPGPVRIVTVGRLSPEKGSVGLIEAFAACRSRGLDAELLMIGDGPGRADVEAAIAAHRLGDRCHLLGALSEADVLRELGDADMFVLPSLMEGLPVVLMESLGAGLPTVAPAVAGVPELVEDGVTGLLFDPGDWSDLADAIVRLAEDPDLGARLAAAGRARVLEEFDVRSAVDSLAERFRRVDGGGNRPS